MNQKTDDHSFLARVVDARNHLANSSSRLCLQQILEQVNVATLWKVADSKLWCFPWLLACLAQVIAAVSQSRCEVASETSDDYRSLDHEDLLENVEARSHEVNDVSEVCGHDSNNVVEEATFEAQVRVCRASSLCMAGENHHRQICDLDMPHELNLCDLTQLYQTDHRPRPCLEVLSCSRRNVVIAAEDFEGVEVVGRDGRKVEASAVRSDDAGRENESDDEVDKAPAMADGGDSRLCTLYVSEMDTIYAPEFGCG